MQSGGRSVTYFNGSWMDGRTPIMTANTPGAGLGSMVFDGGRIYRRLGPDIDLHCARAVESARTIGLAPTIDGPAIERLAWQGADQFGDDAELYVRPMFWAEDGPLGPDVRRQGPRTAPGRRRCPPTRRPPASTRRSA